MSNQILIGDLARRVGINAKTIRYYEDAGVLPPAERLPNGYRVCSADDEDRFRFVRHAWSLGLSDVEFVKKRGSNDERETD